MRLEEYLAMKKKPEAAEGLKIFMKLVKNLLKLDLPIEGWELVFIDLQNMIKKVK